MKVLLVEPDFPIPKKSKNHSAFLPIGLLKIGTYHGLRGDKVQLVRGNVEKAGIRFRPDVVKITSLFTYWSAYVKETVQHYTRMFPIAQIQVGGIFATMMPEACKSVTECDVVSPGLYADGAAENLDVDYSLLPEPVDYQIVHASRGCVRKCSFCAAWKLEPDITFRQSIVKDVRSNRLVFYDNNLLANPHIEHILGELSKFKFRKKLVYSECQSGIDGRILQKKPKLALALKKAHFLNPRIAWDTALSDEPNVKEQIDILSSVGYKAGRCDTDVFVFMLFNHKQPYEELCEKLECCRRWGVLIIDCRYRPLNLLEDGYRPRAKWQDDDEYHISKNWSDSEVRGFRRKVRRQNIAIRLGLPDNRYVDGVERRYLPI